MLIVGEEDAVDQTHEGLRKTFKITVEEATEFLGCKWERTKGGYLVHQLDIIKRLESSFGEEVSTLKEFSTPSGENFKVTKVKENEPNLEPMKQHRYRNGIGMTLYLSRYSRPDICNATRELSKGMVKANEAHYKQMLRLIRYTLCTKELLVKQALIEGP